MDWRLLLQLVTLIIMVIGFIINFTKTQAIRDNDLKHLIDDVAELKGSFAHYVKKLYNLVQRVAHLEGKTK